MNRLLTVCVLLIPTVVFAQVPVPPVPPVPPAAPAAPVAPLAPRPVAPLDMYPSAVLADQARAIAAQARAIADRARIDAKIATADGLLRIEPELAQLKDLQLDLKFAADLQVPIKIGPDGRSSSAGGNYNSGLGLLQQRQFERAIVSFDRSVAQKEERADGALYWKAFAQYRLLRRDDALATITALRRDFPQSRYLADAKVLETDARRVTGGTFDANAVAADEDIRILALQGLQQSATDKAVALIEGVLTASHSLRVKRQAMAVLGQSQDPQAHQVLLRYAKGAGNPDLQMEAIRQLASRPGRPATASDLQGIYTSTNDTDVRMAVLAAYRQTGDKAALKGIYTTSGADIILRRAAVSSLSDLLTADELLAMYRAETDQSLRIEMVNLFGRLRATQILGDIAKTDKDPAVRQRAIRALGEPRTPETSALLSQLYAGTQDVDTKKAIISTLAGRADGEALVAIARTETSLPLKTDIVRRLSAMAPESKAAADFLMGVLNR